MIFLAWLALSLTACSSKTGSLQSASSGGEVSPVDYSPENVQDSQIGAASTNLKEAAPPGMVAFDGSLFVASTKLVPEEWRMAGWRIGEQAIDTENRQAPPDCTLYPHLGVADQWVGSCNGHVLIPQAGASNIAVILTHPDGSTTMVQVAPPPITP